ncbi:peptidoglycan DD-metalloendopeptidase family protein [Nocardioides rubriscoriae]|uniref:peptidoglycan DD-metalloendopeptidase family protein n=1 Tax=Nocardioides rubriscoriae TaxID=642762 RepID=UPI0011E042DA|nr:peptidoglycan DD-metalloendopeptidase family protein [Nocardioides rubriscoriae]
MRHRTARTRLLGVATSLAVALACAAAPLPGARADGGSGTAAAGAGAYDGDRSGADELSALRRELRGADISTLAAKAAEIQAAFVSAAIGYRQARTDAAAAREVAAAKKADLDEAQGVVEAARAELRSSVISAYTEGMGPRSSPLAAVLSSRSDSPSDALAAGMSLQLMISLARASDARAQQVLDRAQILAEEAARAEAAAHDAERRAEAMLTQIQRQAKVLAHASQRAVGAAEEIAEAQQAARDRAAAEQWQAYLRSLARAGVKAPTAAQMLDPRTLPDRFGPLELAPPPSAPRSARPRQVRGVATTRSGRSTLTVLPAQTIAVVTRAFAALGTPYEVDASGPDSYDCGGFTQALWADEGFRLGPDPAAQLAASMPVSYAEVQVGDLVFTGTRRRSLQNVGLYVGADLMLAADGPTAAVAVVPVSSPVAVARVTLPAPTRPGRRGARREPADSATIRCGLDTQVSSTAGFVSPVAEGDFTFTSRWGETGPHWASYHTGLDFAAAPGTPVVSVLAGTVVSVEDSPWAGPFYTTIDHGDGVTTTYAHMERSDVDPGDVVEPGQLIGAVGAYGNATGPHLHLEVHVDGYDVDPMPYLLGTAATTGAGWGGLANGMIPTNLLCPVTAAPGHLLRCDAARALDVLASAYEDALGEPFCVTDSYRTYAAQVALFARKPSLAAVPGTSNHGWALAVDLCGGAESFGTPEHDWLVANAPRWGWVDPTWARPGGSKPEPWHWEFGQVS